MKEVIIDTGPLLLHAFYKFRGGILLEKVNPSIPKPDLKNVVITLDRFISSMRRIVTTPYIISEFHALARHRAGLKDSEIVKFIEEYVEILSKIDEVHVEKNEILKFKKSWKLCFADTSIFLLAKRIKVPVLSTDQPLVNYCYKNGIKALHLYYDLYLSESFRNSIL